MEFVEHIRIPRCDRVVLIQPHKPKIHGSLCITGHHLIVSSKHDPKKESALRKELWLLHSSIDHIEYKQLGMTGGLIWLKCKDLRILQLDIIGPDNLAKVVESLENLKQVNDPGLKYPFFYQPMYSILEDGWTAFSAASEFRQMLHPVDEWRISHVNKEFKVCPSYPSVVVVPKGIEDSEIVAAASFRQGNRFPVMAYRHEEGSVLLRSSQHITTPNLKRSKEDEKFMSCVLGPDRKGYIIDTRVQNTSHTNKLRGGSTHEGDLHYFNWRTVHKPTDKRHVWLESLVKLMEAINDTNSDKYLSRLDSSGWMHHIKDILNCSCLVAQCLDQEGASVLVHDTDGMDATLQVTSLAQIILNPDCRTVRGFEALIEREWLSAGHPFGTRHAHSCYSPKEFRNSKLHSPTFLLFLDCVHQIHSQFMCSFEFSENFLHMIFEHSYSSQFGTFLLDSPQSRTRLGVTMNTTSLWSYINRPEILRQYLNPMYEPNQSVIWPSVAPMSLNVWSLVLLRWVVDPQPFQDALEAARELKERDAETRSRVVKLRKKMANLEKEALKLGLLAGLPDLEAEHKGEASAKS